MGMCVCMGMGMCMGMCVHVHVCTQAEGSGGWVCQDAGACMHACLCVCVCARVRSYYGATTVPTLPPSTWQRGRQWKTIGVGVGVVVGVGAHLAAEHVAEGKAVEDLG